MVLVWRARWRSDERTIINWHRVLLTDTRDDRWSEAVPTDAESTKGAIPLVAYEATGHSSVTRRLSTTRSCDHAGAAFRTNGRRNACDLVFLFYVARYRMICDAFPRSVIAANSSLSFWCCRPYCVLFHSASGSRSMMQTVWVTVCSYQ